MGTEAPASGVEYRVWIEVERCTTDETGEEHYETVEQNCVGLYGTEAEANRAALALATEEEWANARLIAAAPDLLEALSALLADINGLPEPVRNKACCEKARAALDKARGIHS